ncbi:MAG TPA: energy-coupling factor transporter transmembrane component T [Thermodesulfovibrio thiophilus]|uniref:energy-coupling factor transporter transmembrane component T family protein n=1 Tax=Thermodesulfovibrio thiophilus TaxID=340095 RepID=UPI000400431D|nr:energy-coupling factor transporter transmembrane component T [Thermodesulfovibrio thiophilus]HQA03633.1 energy-coupling factor transporter transmembrane component T [Thermodesulfovibrio thiophilus]HQD35822.1 energy-coupling factor transporter transmembrane component T [Thermodesulfovibrio thiophilus]
MKHNFESDGRVNVLVLIVILSLILSHRGFIFNSLIIFLCGFTILLLDISFKSFIKRVTEPVFIGCVVVAIKSGLPFHFYIDGFFLGIQIFLKIMASVSVVSLFFYFTSFYEILHGLKFLKIPSTFIEILFLTARFIFILQDEAERIYNAQKQRLGYTGFWKMIKSVSILSASLISNALRHAEQSFIAMRQRGYEGEMVIRRQNGFAFKSLIPCYPTTLIIILWFIF